MRSYIHSQKAWQESRSKSGSKNMSGGLLIRWAGVIEPQFERVGQFSEGSAEVALPVDCFFGLCWSKIDKAGEVIR